jgi:hypothetical protein
VENRVTLDVEVANIYNSGKIIDSRHGIMFFPQRWDLSGTAGNAAQLTYASPAVSRE